MGAYHAVSWRVAVFATNTNYNYNTTCEIVSLTASTAVTNTTLQVIQPANRPACPGEEVVLTCTVPPTKHSITVLRWELLDANRTQVTYNGENITATLGDFIIYTNGSFNRSSISSATLKGVLLSHNNITIGCRQPHNILKKIETVMIAGSYINQLQTFMHNKNIPLI